MNKRVVDFMNGMRMSLWIQGLHTYVKEKDFKLICVTDDDAEKTYHFTIPDDIVNMRFSMRGHGVLFGSNPSDEKNSVRLNLEINGPYPRVNGRVLVTNVDAKLVDINNEVPSCQSKEERRKAVHHIMAKNYFGHFNRDIGSTNGIQGQNNENIYIAHQECLKALVRNLLRDNFLGYFVSEAVMYCFFASSKIKKYLMTQIDNNLGDGKGLKITKETKFWAGVVSAVCNEGNTSPHECCTYGLYEDSAEDRAVMKQVLEVLNALKELRSGDAAVNIPEQQVECIWQSALFIAVLSGKKENQAVMAKVRHVLDIVKVLLNGDVAVNISGQDVELVWRLVLVIAALSGNEDHVVMDRIHDLLDAVKLWRSVSIFYVPVQVFKVVWRSVFLIAALSELSWSLAFGFVAIAFFILIAKYRYVLCKFILVIIVIFIACMLA